jgi:hypothetical protein
MTGRNLTIISACVTMLLVAATGCARKTSQSAATQTPPPATTKPSTPPAAAKPAPSPSATIPDRPGVVYADRASATATVEAVDKSQRTVTLRRADGRSVMLKVPPEARNFDQIQPGDTVRAEYLDAVAVFVRKAGAPPQAAERTAVAVAPKGGMPAGVIVETVEVTAKVEAVDGINRTVTLRGPEGNVRTVKVDESVKRFDEVKPGDEVVIRHTQALALKLER